MDAFLGPSTQPSKEERLAEFLKKRQLELASKEVDGGRALQKRPRPDTHHLEPRNPATGTPIPLTQQSLSGLKVRRNTTATPARASRRSESPTKLAADPVVGRSKTSQDLPGDGLLSQKPQWYEEITVRDMQANVHVSLKVKLEQTKEYIRDFSAGYDREACLQRLRKQLHQMLYLHTTGLRQHHWPATVKASGILNKKTGLPAIFDAPQSESGVEYPYDIRADAREIYNKWFKADFDINILRGLITRTAGNRSADAIDPAAKVPWTYFGNGNLVNGQWWPTQLAAVRDGAHGSAQGGIAGMKSDEHGNCGATSIVLAGGYAEDRDEGDEIWYTGTEGTKAAPTENTTRLMESVRGHHTINGEWGYNPVRVLRSHNLGKSSRYAPKKGFRYDGLYKAVDWKTLDAEKQVLLFHLVRLPGQDPIRAVGVEARPTDEEIDAYNKLREVNKDFM